MVYFRRIYQRAALVGCGIALLCDGDRHSAGTAVLQICQPVLLAVRERNYLRRRSCFNAGQCNLDHLLRTVDGGL